MNLKKERAIRNTIMQNTTIWTQSKVEKLKPNSPGSFREFFPNKYVPQKLIPLTMLLKRLQLQSKMKMDGWYLY